MCVGLSKPYAAQVSLACRMVYQGADSSTLHLRCRETVSHQAHNLETAGSTPAGAIAVFLGGGRPHEPAQLVRLQPPQLEN